MWLSGVGHIETQAQYDCGFQESCPDCFCLHIVHLGMGFYSLASVPLSSQKYKVSPLNVIAVVGT